MEKLFPLYDFCLAIFAVYGLFNYLFYFTFGLGNLDKASIHSVKSIT
jgi:hypothetical protein